MKIFPYGLLTCLCALLTSCVYTREAFYMSPSDVRASPYVTLPMADDPQKTVTSVSATFGVGNSNQHGRDNLTGGSTAIMQSHHFGHFQAYYGAALGMGDYDNSSVELGRFYFIYPGRDSGSYSISSVKKFYGYYGLNGGMNVVIPFANGKGEWRALGIDAAYRKEFGDYLGFRRSLPTDKMGILAAYDHMFTLGWSTEIVGRNSRDYQFGYKIGLGGMFLPSGQYKGFDNNSRPYYFSNTFQVTKNKLTGYVQLVTGTHAFVFQTGVNINLRKRTHDFPVPERGYRTDRPRSPGERRRGPFERKRMNKTDAPE